MLPPDAELPPENSMLRRRRFVTSASILWSFLAVAFIGPVILGLISLWKLNAFSPHPDDQELKSLIVGNREAFQELLNMFDEDTQLKLVSPDAREPAESISDSRWEAYRSLFKSIGLDTGMIKRADGAVVFPISSLGLSVSGSSKGLIYRPSDPSPHYPSLDEVPDELGEGVVAYRKLEGDWYVTYTYTN